MMSSEGFCIIAGYCPHGFYQTLAYNAPIGFLLGILLLPNISALVMAILKLLHRKIEPGFTVLERNLAFAILIIFVLMVPVSLGFSDYFEYQSEKENCRHIIEQRTQNGKVDFGKPHISPMCFENGEPIIEELEGVEEGDVIKRTDSGYEVVNENGK